MLCVKTILGLLDLSRMWRFEPACGTDQFRVEFNNWWCSTAITTPVHLRFPPAYD
jgi:hypothetical protein